MDHYQFEGKNQTNKTNQGCQLDSRIGLSTGGNPSDGISRQADVADSGVAFDANVAVLAPVGSPRVAHDPVGAGTAALAVTDDDDAVVDAVASRLAAIVAVRVVEDALAVATLEIRVRRRQPNLT